VPLIAYFINVVHVKQYLVHLLRAGYTCQSIRNHLISLVRLGHYAKARTQLGQMKEMGSIAFAQKKIQAFLTWSKAELAFFRKKATKETITRNCRQVYEVENRWVTFAELIKVNFAFCALAANKLINWSLFLYRLKSSFVLLLMMSIYLRSKQP
jgi:UV DNA damage repair endonuclease